MNGFKLLLSSVLMTIVMAACGFDADRADELADKISLGKALTQDEYAECIELCDAALNDYLEKAKSFKGLTLYEFTIKRNEMSVDDDYVQMISDAYIMYRALDRAFKKEDELNSENKKAFKALQKLEEKVDEAWEKVNDEYYGV